VEGAGRLWKRDRAWVLDYADARGQRRREVLGCSKREAEELRVEIIARRTRSMWCKGTSPLDPGRQSLVDAATRRWAPIQ
jgi:hypothetical protein